MDVVKLSVQVEQGLVVRWEARDSPVLPVLKDPPGSPDRSVEAARPGQRDRKVGPELRVP